MKKLLLILALLAYAAISCDKPETTNDEPEPRDTSSDTCQIYIKDENGVAWGSIVAMVYNTSSSNIDFDASVNSIFKHFTITLKDGSLDTAIGSNIYGASFPSDTGCIYSENTIDSHIDSLKYGDYVVVVWMLSEGHRWGPYYYNASQSFLYRDITLDSAHTDATITLNRELLDQLTFEIVKSEPPHFTEF